MADDVEGVVGRLPAPKKSQLTGGWGAEGDSARAPFFWGQAGGSYVTKGKPAREGGQLSADEM